MLTILRGVFSKSEDIQGGEVTDVYGLHSALGRLNAFDVCFSLSALNSHKFLQKYVRSRN